jgi:hypothetical protein
LLATHKQKSPLARPGLRREAGTKMDLRQIGGGGGGGLDSPGSG